MRAVLSLFAQKGMVSMIKIRIRNAGHEVDVRFPISESELYKHEIILKITMFSRINSKTSIYSSPEF